MKPRRNWLRLAVTLAVVAGAVLVSGLLAAGETDTPGLGTAPSVSGQATIAVAPGTLAVVVGEYLGERTTTETDGSVTLHRVCPGWLAGEKAPSAGSGLVWMRLRRLAGADEESGLGTVASLGIVAAGIPETEANALLAGLLDDLLAGERIDQVDRVTIEASRRSGDMVFVLRLIAPRPGFLAEEMQSLMCLEAVPDSPIISELTITPTP